MGCGVMTDVGVTRTVFPFKAPISGPNISRALETSSGVIVVFWMRRCSSIYLKWRSDGRPKRIYKSHAASAFLTSLAWNIFLLSATEGTSVKEDDFSCGFVNAGLNKGEAVHVVS